MVRRKLVESCVKELNFCATESRGELQDSVPNKSKGIEDELIIKLKSSMIEVDVCALNKLKVIVLLMQLGQMYNCRH